MNRCTCEFPALFYVHPNDYRPRERTGCVRLVRHRLLERGSGMGELPADGQRLVLAALEPFLDVEIEAGQLVVFRHVDPLPTFTERVAGAPPWPAYS